MKTKLNAELAKHARLPESVCKRLLYARAKMGWINVKEEYETVSLRAEKNVKCKGCGKRLKRSKTFSQTLNPFNKKDGRLKTRQEIYEELSKESTAWHLVKEYCKECKTNGNVEKNVSSKTITVCDKCLQASCWQGIFMCDKADIAGTVEKTIDELKALNLENPCYWESA
ncbi:MAG: hypothetical protein CV087_10470 [Candidatus Brocadia sp. WS118]|nr:MAG: hypothetical protein CV087_10470 [Candidatus Brocadia sp. WS118]